MKPKVWNKRGNGIPAGAVYVGRPSKWGNPFVIGRDGTRAEVIAKYRVHLGDSGLIEQIGELRGKDLICWCSPAPCHADVLLELANAPKKRVLPANKLMLGRAGSRFLCGFNLIFAPQGFI
jgi:hypothetical protein